MENGKSSEPPPTEYYYIPGSPTRVPIPGPPRTFRAPGRVNLIGEHTDYNDGFVLPAAIDFSAQVTLIPRHDRQIIAVSEHFNQRIRFDLGEPRSFPAGHWIRYVYGVATTLEKAGFSLNGAGLKISSDVPVGAGLSSSAAIEVAVGYALLTNSGYPVDPTQLATLCQSAEHEFVGTRCGIMDQFTACHARQGTALLLDCRSLAHSFLPLPADVRLVICNTMVKHQLAASEYNQRRAECEAGVRHLAQQVPGAQALRDITLSQLEAYSRDLPDPIYRRCRHVITENDRVLKAKAALDHGDLKTFGRLMNESHQSLRDDYEVSCPELDLMVTLATGRPGVYGSRMTGGGFGGCTISLVASDQVDPLIQHVAKEYEAGTGRHPEIYTCTPAAGASEIEFVVSNAKITNDTK